MPPLLGGVDTTYTFSCVFRWKYLIGIYRYTMDPMGPIGVGGVHCFLAVLPPKKAVEENVVITIGRSTGFPQEQFCFKLDFLLLPRSKKTTLTDT